MENFSDLLICLDSKTKSLMKNYSELLEKNKNLLAEISGLENQIKEKNLLLKEKENCLNEQKQEKALAGMIIDDLIITLDQISDTEYSEENFQSKKLNNNFAVLEESK